MSSICTSDDDTLECTCKQIREMCDDLITEATNHINLCPILTLPNIAIDSNKCHETVETHLESFQKGSYVVWKDIGRCAPQEVEKTMNFVVEAERRLNEELNKDVSTDESLIETNDTEKEKDERPMSRDTETSRITEEFQFIKRIATIFKFHGKGLTVGRMMRNCAITLEKGQLTVITLDSRYQYCSTKDIMYIRNLCHFQKRFNSDMIIQIGDHVTLKLIKQIGMHLTCCVLVGGIVKSYAEVFIEGYDPERLSTCLTESDKENCHLALKYQVTAVVLPQPHSACYVSQIQRFFSCHDNECRIQILVEFDKDLYLCDESLHHQEMILHSLKEANGVYLSKPFTSVLEDVFSIIHKKIIISKYLPETDFESNCGLNAFLPTCFLLQRHRHEPLASQIASFSSTINTVHQSAITQCLRCDSLNTKAFVSITSSGDKAIELSCTRRAFPIIAITDNEQTAKELYLYKGVKPIYYDWKELEGRSDKSTIKYLLRLSVAYARHLCLLYGKFCIKQYEMLGENDKTTSCN